MNIICLIFLLLPALAATYNPCCSFPCQNRGVCTREADSYTCDCTYTGYYGRNCETPELWTRVTTTLMPSVETFDQLLKNYDWFWYIINNTPLRKFVMREVSKVLTSQVDNPVLYHTGHDYTTWDSYSARTYYARALPPVPADCPTPMGTKGPKELPSPEYLAETFLARKTFLPDTRRRSNVLLGFMAQHFTHQFFKTDFEKGPGRTWSDHAIDMSHVYGETPERQQQLRTFQDGKLKHQLIDGEMYPPKLQDAPVHMIYPPNVPEDKRYALGHEFFGLLPGLFVWATVWLREHNRLCDVMKEVHPDWDDERLYQTARLILVGETLKIVVEEYVQHLGGYSFQMFWDPELLFKERFQYHGRTVVEFNHLYHWHPLMPDQFHIGGTTYDVGEFLFNNDVVLKHGFNATVDAMSRQIAGKFGAKNIGAVNLKVSVATIKHERELRMQSLNQYRKRFDMPPYKTFQELTGDAELAALLEEAYGDIDAVELYVGWVIEQPAAGGVLSQMFLQMASPFSFKGILANPICSPGWWKPSTFGGEVGFDIVKTTTLKDLFCRNMKGPCGLVSFAVPEDVEPTGLSQPGGGKYQGKQTAQSDEL